MLKEYPTSPNYRHSNHNRNNFYNRWKGDLVLLPFTHRLFDCLQIIGELVIDDDGKNNATSITSSQKEKEKKEEVDPSNTICLYLNDTKIVDSLSALTILAHYRMFLHDCFYDDNDDNDDSDNDDDDDNDDSDNDDNDDNDDSDNDDNDDSDYDDNDDNDDDV